MYQWYTYICIKTAECFKSLNSIIIMTQLTTTYMYTSIYICSLVVLPQSRQKICVISFFVHRQILQNKPKYWFCTCVYICRRTDRRPTFSSIMMTSSFRSWSVNHVCGFVACFYNTQKLFSLHDVSGEQRRCPMPAQQKQCN
jgi:hypothetical protein